eukprot:11273307-Ditylum_brightwellii.AAC.2
MARGTFAKIASAERHCISQCVRGTGEKLDGVSQVEKVQLEGACAQKRGANGVACTVAAACPSESGKVVTICLGLFQRVCLGA